MGIALLIHTTDIYRKEKVVGKGLTSNFVKKYEGVKCLVVPAQVGDTLNQNTTIGKDYNVFFDTDMDVKQGDKLTTSTGLTLLVNGVANYDDVPEVAHIETTCSTQGD